MHEILRDEKIKTHPFWPLITEINMLKETLRELDRNDQRFTARIEEHSKRIEDAIPPNPGNISCFMGKPCPQYSFPDIYCPYPLCLLLNRNEFHTKEIPLNILELLVSAGFDVNGVVSLGGKTCLHCAIDGRHYNAVRWLVEHGADCNALNDFKETPIACLAADPHVPLDLFDLLMTPENLNDGTDKRLPLYKALWHGRINSALHLISLGAEVDKINGYYKCLPIHYYFRHVEQFEFHEELFAKLLPQSGINTVEIIHKITLENFAPDVISKIVYPLLQRHVNTGGLSLSRDVPNNADECRGFYLDSLFVLLLDADVARMPDIAKMTNSMPEETWKQVNVDIWEAYDQQHGKLKSLLRLCIQRIRRSMRHLDDESFQSLPTPSKLRNLLMLQEVSGVLCEAWKAWPKCLPVVADIISNWQ